MASPRKPVTFTGSSPLAPLMAQFVQEKRACGYRFNPAASSLRRLDAHLCSQGLQQVELPKAATASWLAKQPHETGKTQRARVNLVRNFALFMRRLDLPADVPDHAVGAKDSRPFLARVLTHGEVRRLLEAADRIEPMASTHLRHIVLPELLRVLYGCGLRLEEALRLRMRDVDLVQGVLRINDTKFRKDRLVPPARPLVVRLQKYAAALGPRSDDEYFFPSPRGGRLDGGGVYRNFRELLHRCGIGHGGRGEGPRLHDLRHTFAVHTLLRWYREGADLQARMPVLATYLGHASIDGTQDYLQMTAELHPEIVSRSDAAFSDVIPRGPGGRHEADRPLLHVTNYLTRYLAGQRNLSPNTIKAYRDVFTLLLRFGRDGRGIAVERLCLADIDVTFVEAFLDHLSQERKCSIRTQNQRLAVLHAFFRYVQSEVPERMLQCQKIMAMPLRRHVQVPVAYMSKDELTQVLAHPDPTTSAGRRDAVMLSVLYDTGARAQELIDLNAHDVRLTTPAQVRLLGKGRKVRVVPLMDATARLLRDHLRENDLDRPERGHLPLFQNRQGGRLSRSGLRYLLHCHVQAARSAVPGFTQKISPHSMRHTKGMHLLQSGVSLEMIRDFLGHVDVKTTQIYARANLEMKRRALEKVAGESPSPSAAVLAAEQVAARLAALAVATSATSTPKPPSCRRMRSCATHPYGGWTCWATS
jgi:integrase/recombinase XerD